MMHYISFATVAEGRAVQVIESMALFSSEIMLEADDYHRVFTRSNVSLCFIFGLTVILVLQVILSFDCSPWKAEL